MNPFFNVTSTGATATSWLTNLLNSHPDITAFHALRVDPFIPNSPDVSFKTLFDGLEILKGRLLGTSSIGAIHTFYHSNFRTELKEMQGGHLAMIRDPIRRIHSLFTTHYSTSHNVPLIDNDTYITLVRNDHLSKISSPEDVFKIPLNEYEKRFYSLCNATLKNDILNVIQCPPQEIGIFEEFTKDQDYFCGLMDILLGTDDPFFEAKFVERQNKKINPHARKIVTARSIFEAWPLPLKHMFFHIALLHGLDNIRKVYTAYGYEDTVEMIFDWFHQAYPNIDPEEYAYTSGSPKHFSLVLNNIDISPTLERNNKFIRFSLDVVQKQQDAIEKGKPLPYDHRKYRRALIVGKSALRSQ